MLAVTLFSISDTPALVTFRHCLSLPCCGGSPCAQLGWCTRHAHPTRSAPNLPRRLTPRSIVTPAAAPAAPARATAAASLRAAARRCFRRCLHHSRRLSPVPLVRPSPPVPPSAAASSPPRSSFPSAVSVGRPSVRSCSCFNRTSKVRAGCLWWTGSRCSRSPPSLSRHSPRAADPAGSAQRRTVVRY